MASTSGSVGGEVTGVPPLAKSALPPPRPKSPPEYPDLYGKRREAARVQMLEREIGYLEASSLILFLFKLLVVFLLFLSTTISLSFFNLPHFDYSEEVSEYFEFHDTFVFISPN